MLCASKSVCVPACYTAFFFTVLPTYIYHQFLSMIGLLLKLPVGTYNGKGQTTFSFFFFFFFFCFAGKIAINRVIKVHVNKFSFRGNKNNIFILASLTNGYQLLTEKNCSCRSKFFALHGDLVRETTLSREANRKSQKLPFFSVKHGEFTQLAKHACV